MREGEERRKPMPTVDSLFLLCRVRIKLGFPCSLFSKHFLFALCATALLVFDLSPTSKPSRARGEATVSISHKKDEKRIDSGLQERGAHIRQRCLCLPGIPEDLHRFAWFRHWYAHFDTVAILPSIPRSGWFDWGLFN